MWKVLLKGNLAVMILIMVLQFTVCSVLHGLLSLQEVPFLQLSKAYKTIKRICIKKWEQDCKAVCYVELILIIQVILWILVVSIDVIVIRMSTLSTHHSYV